MKAVGIVPARLRSSRLPEKALVEIEGLPMVVHTCKRAALARSLDHVCLATDSPRIGEAAEAHGIDVIMTGEHHRTGSDRIAEAAGSMDCDIVVNIQGDEPLVRPEHIDAVTSALMEDPDLSIAVGVTPYDRKDSPSDIKAVVDLEGNVLYCSRADLPSGARTDVGEMLKMCFIVPFRKDFLIEYASWEPTPLERIEFNEYLRVLEHGVRMRGVMIEDARISVDTPEDLAVVRKLMREDDVKRLYM